MNKLMPLRRVVVEITNEAPADDEQSIKKAVRSWYNKLAGGSIPRDVLVKLGRDLFLDLEAWDTWLKTNQRESIHRRIGRPRNV
jgi:hypothetical protein